MAFHLGELVAKPTQDKDNGRAVDAVIKLAWIVQEGAMRSMPETERRTLQAAGARFCSN
jgi:hypothetical protein